LPYDGLPSDTGLPGGPDFNNTEYSADYDLTDELLLSSRILKRGDEFVHDKEVILDSTNPTDKVVLHMCPPSYLENNHGTKIFHEYEAKDLEKVEIIHHDGPPKLSFYKNQKKISEVVIDGSSFYDIH
jgi:hypothetical protein